MLVPFIIIGSGQLGTEFQKHFVQSGVDHVVFDYPDIDITSLESLKQLGEYQPAVILNCAAYTDVDKAEADHKSVMAVNYDGARNLALVAKEYGALLVHYSTDYVFAGTSTTPHNERHGVNPVNFYGYSKATGEAEVRWSSKANLVIRTSQLYGNKGPNFVLNVLGWARKSGTLRGVVDQFGSPTYTKDLVEGTLKLISAKARGLYHLTNAGCCSKYELMKAVAEIKQLDVEVTEALTADFPTPAIRPLRPVMSIEKVQKYYQPRPWREALEDYLSTL